MHAAGEYRSGHNPYGAGQITHLGGQNRTDQRTGSGDGGEMVAEHHPTVGGHVVHAVVEIFGRGGVIVAGAAQGSGVVD